MSIFGFEVPLNGCVTSSEDCKFGLAFRIRYQTTTEYRDISEKY